MALVLSLGFLLLNEVAWANDPSLPLTIVDWKVKRSPDGESVGGLVRIKNTLTDSIGIGDMRLRVTTLDKTAVAAGEWVKFTTIKTEKTKSRTLPALTIKAMPILWLDIRYATLPTGTTQEDRIRRVHIKRVRYDEMKMEKLNPKTLSFFVLAGASPVPDRNGLLAKALEKMSGAEDGATPLTLNSGATPASTPEFANQQAGDGAMEEEEPEIVPGQITFLSLKPIQVPDGRSALRLKAFNDSYKLPAKRLRLIMKLLDGGGEELTTIQYIVPEAVEKGDFVAEIPVKNLPKFYLWKCHYAF
ncbi:MAG: hypothetical protein ACYTGH_19415 [Planctomycetota bacterium]